ncbi:MAG: hypothetical protein L0Z53_27405, partial [Acidobacteriales bacterium]|nr:hypothetical protein [Terriglobales bacterium]
MFRKLVLPWCAVLLGIATCHFAVAQGLMSAPRNQGGRAAGYAATEMSRIMRQDLGTGYTGESLNRIALNSARANVANVGQQSTRPGPIGLGPATATGPANKPFSSFSPSPTVSPYLNLFREDLDGNSDFNYQTLVRPQLQQQQFNQQQQRQNLDINARLQQISAQADFNPQGSQSQYPTGHQTARMYY